MPKRFVYFGLCMACCVLIACTSLNSAVIDAAKAAYFDGKQSYQAELLKPNLVYLEVKTPNASALLVLGYQDKVSDTYLPSVNTWFSGDGSALRTQGGLITSSTGQPEFWHNVHYTFKEGVPTLVQFDSPFNGLYGLKHIFSQVDGSRGFAQTKLMARAAKLPSIVFKFYESTWLDQPEIAQAADFKKQYVKLKYVVGTDSKTGVPVYGLHCLQSDFCVEYLRRTTAQNL